MVAVGAGGLKEVRRRRASSPSPAGYSEHLARRWVPGPSRYLCYCPCYSTIHPSATARLGQRVGVSWGKDSLMGGRYERWVGREGGGRGEEGRGGKEGKYLCGEELVLGIVTRPESGPS